MLAKETEQPAPEPTVVTVMTEQNVSVQTAVAVESLTMWQTVYVPLAAYTCEANPWVLPDVPSPKDHVSLLYQLLEVFQKLY